MIAPGNHCFLIRCAEHHPRGSDWGCAPVIFTDKSKLLNLHEKYPNLMMPNAMLSFLYDSLLFQWLCATIAVYRYKGRNCYDDQP